MATTSMDFTLSTTLLGNLTKGGAGNGAYVFAFAFDGAGKLLRSSTLVDNGVKSATSLKLADNSTVTGGNVIVVTQQVGKGNKSTLPGTVKAIGDLVNTDKAKQLNYRYDAIEFTLLDQGSDVADLTNIVQFGAPISLSVKYSNGTTETRGYALSGQQTVNNLKALSPAGTQNYSWAAGGPLTGQRETLGLANNVVPNPLNVASDWKTYVTGFSKIAGNIYLSAYFNGTGTLSLYKVVYDSGNQVFWLNPVSLGSGVPTTKDSLKIPFATLTQNIYTQTGSLQRYTAMNGTLLQTYSTFTPNDAWGQITRSLVAGFDGGLWGGSANSINPKVTGKLDLNRTWDWSAPYAYQAITAPSGSNKFGYTNSIGLGTGKVGDPNRKMFYDPFAAEFVKNSNAYGYSYSDLLSEGGGVNPSLSIYDPDAKRNVSSIGVKLFDLGETPTGYTPPSFDYVPPSGADYKPANTKSTDQFLFDFALGKYFPAAGVPITFRFYAPGDKQAKNGFVSLSLPTGTTKETDYEQSFTVSGSPGNWKLTANGYSGARGFLLMSGVPVTSDGSTGWYQMVIGTGALAKTYNIYVQSSASSPTNRITSVVVDGGALAQQIPNQANQIKVSFDPAGNITYSPFYFSAPRAQTGDAGSNRLMSAAGADLLAGGAGNDFYYVNDAGDQVIEVGGEGSDAVYTTVDYTLAAGQEIESLRAYGVTTGLVLTGNEFDNYLAGGAGDDTLNGLGGDDRLNGAAGADVMTGGIGNDFYYVDDPTDEVIEAIGQGTDNVYTTVSYTLAPGQEIEALRAYNAVTGLTLTGNEFGNYLLGGPGDDTLIGGGGDDRLNGAGGADIMAGGTGNDKYYVDNAGDRITEVRGQGTDDVYSTIDYTLAAGQEIESLRVYGVTTGLVLTGNEFDNYLAGGAGDDTLSGEDGDDRLNGAGGADIMAGGAGNDKYYVDNAGDRITEARGQGTDDVYSTIDYTLAAGQEIESLRVYGVTAGLTLTGNEFDNYLAGGAGDDTLSGEGGDDRLDGGGGADIMAGGTGNDKYYVDNAGDQVIEEVGGGIDNVYSTVSWSMAAGEEIEGLRAYGAGATSGVFLTGNEFANTLLGGSGSDELDGGAGADTLIGGGGDDIFHFSTTLGSGNVDRIADFTAGDSIHLDHTVFAGLALGQLSASAFALDNATGSAPQIVYDHGTGALSFDSNGASAGGSTQFASLTGAPSLTASDFKVT